MHAIILSIGDELVLGQTIDTNSGFLSAKLASRGIGTLYHQAVADDQRAITRAIDQAAKLAPLVIVSGGLGPTDDDLTRQALADAMGVGLVLHEPSVEVIRQMMEKRGRKMAERNRIQAMHPAGTEVIPNDCGTAPGIKAKLHGATIYVTPGVPREMYVMFDRSIVPELDQFGADRQAILTLKINTFGLGESMVADRLGELMDRTRNPVVGTTVSDGIVAVRIRSEFPTAVEAQQQLDDTIRLVEERLGAVVFGRESQTLQESVVSLLKAGSKTVAVAESCTGGLLGAMITEVPGSSSVFVGGWITYANEMKRSMLGVSPEVLNIHGAVSEQTARVMAQGAMANAGADFAIAITGIAGPDGGTADKPVGTVWIALAQRGGDPLAQRFLFGNDRPTNRDRAAKTALQLLRLRLLGESDETLNSSVWAVAAKV